MRTGEWRVRRHAPRQIERAVHQRVTFDDLVEDAEAEELVGLEDLAGEEDLLGGGVADGAGGA